MTEMRRRKVGRPPANAVDGRGALLEAARQLFAVRGFAGTSTRQIAAAAKVNIGLIKYYFESKEGLYQACLEGIREGNLKLVARLLTPATSTADVAAKLATLVESAFAQAVADPAAWRLIDRAVQEGQNDADYDAIMVDVMVRPMLVIAAFFDQARQDGLIRFTAHPLAMANLVNSFVSHHVRTDPLKKRVLGMTIEDLRHRQELASVVTNIMMDGMRPPEPVKRPGKRD